MAVLPLELFVRAGIIALLTVCCGRKLERSPLLHLRFLGLPPACGPQSQEELCPEEALLGPGTPPLNYDLGGKQLRRFRCPPHTEGTPHASPQERAACCQNACEDQDECEHWSSNHLAECRLQRNFAGDISLAQKGWNFDLEGLVLSNFKNGTGSGTGLSVNQVLGMRPLATDIQQLRLEMVQPCPQPHFMPVTKAGASGSSRGRGSREGARAGESADDEAAGESERIRVGRARAGEGADSGSPLRPPLRAWVQWAMLQSDGQVQRFPEEEVLLSTRTCANRSNFLQLRWYRPSVGGGAGVSGSPHASAEVDAEDAGLMWAEETDGAFVSQANLKAFRLLARPGCSVGQRPWPWRSHVPPLRPWLGVPDTLPEARGVALSSSDFHQNLYHAVTQMLFLQRGQRLYEELQADAATGRLLPKEEGLESVPWDMSLDFGRRKGSLRSPLLELLAEVLGVRGLLEREQIPPPAEGEPHRCYRLVMQKLFRAEVSPPQGTHSYNQLLTRRCFPSRPQPQNQPSPGQSQTQVQLQTQGVLCRRMFFVSKPSDHWTRRLRAPRWVEQHLRRFATAQQLGFRSSHLSGAEVAGMTVCEQLGLFLQLALFINIVGAAGIHVLWMPPGSVLVDVGPQNGEWQTSVFLQSFQQFQSRPLHTRTVGQHLFTEWATQGGRLFVSYQSVLALGYLRGSVPLPEELALEPQDLVAVLKVIHRDWLEPRLPPASEPQPEECGAWDAQ